MASIENAITTNNAKILQLLITVPGTFSQHDLNTGLIQAAKLGHVESAKCLLDAGADKNFATPVLYTPLHIATLNNKGGIVDLLLAYKCEVNVRGVARFTPLHIAAKYGYVDILEALIKYGANVNSKDSEGNSPLIIAARNIQYLVMKHLIQVGCDLNSANVDGCTALHYACHKARGFQMLLDAGANPDVRDNDNITPLLMAACEGFDAVVTALVEKQCDVNIANNSVKRTALHILAFKGHTKCINDLIYGGANIDVCDTHNHSPLWYAIKNKKVEVVRLLLKSYSHADTFQCPHNVSEDECPTRLAFRQQLLGVVKYFILTGYDHCHLRECLQDNELSDWLKNVEDFSHWLDYASGAQSLKQQCRKWIRHHLGRQFYHHLQFLPIPDVLKEYLFLEELHDH